MATSKNATSAMILERIDNLANIAEIFLVERVGAAVTRASESGEQLDYRDDKPPVPAFTLTLFP
jgi:hypothetical protein